MDFVFRGMLVTIAFVLGRPVLVLCGIVVTDDNLPDAIVPDDVRDLPFKSDAILLLFVLMASVVLRKRGDGCDGFFPFCCCVLRIADEYFSFLGCEDFNFGFGDGIVLIAVEDAVMAVFVVDVLGDVAVFLG